MPYHKHHFHPSLKATGFFCLNAEYLSGGNHETSN